MQINFSNQEPILDTKNSIFLAGPTMRDNDVAFSWRMKAIKILNNYKFDGIVYVPEYKSGLKFNNKKIEEQTRWEWACLDNCGVIVFWIPRSLPDMPGFTTNIEFGRYITIKPDNVVLGFPDTAEKMKYLELLYEEQTSRIRCSTLQSTLQKALDIINK